MAERHASQVASLCRLIERRDDVPTLAELADHVGLSPFHTHRRSKAATGVTPRAYAVLHRANRVRATLRTAPTVTEAIYAAGFNSAGRFYARSAKPLGMTPTKYKAGGADLPVRFAFGVCLFGLFFVVVSV